MWNRQKKRTLLLMLKRASSSRKNRRMLRDEDFPSTAKRSRPGPDYNTLVFNSISDKLLKRESTTE